MTHNAKLQFLKIIRLSIISATISNCCAFLFRGDIKSSSFSALFAFTNLTISRNLKMHSSDVRKTQLWLIQDRFRNTIYKLYMQPWWSKEDLCSARRARAPLPPAGLDGAHQAQELPPLTAAKSPPTAGQPMNKRQRWNYMCKEHGRWRTHGTFRL